MKEEIKVIAQFDTEPEASLFLSRLQAERIWATMDDNKTILADWGLSYAIGGIKISVKVSDFDKAKAIIEKVFSERRKQRSGQEKKILFNCEYCNAEITIPESKKGTVQSCPRCFEYIDVPDG